MPFPIFSRYWVEEMHNCAEFQVSKLNRIRNETVGVVIGLSDTAVLKFRLRTGNTIIFRIEDCANMFK